MVGNPSINADLHDYYRKYFLVCRPFSGSAISFTPLQDTFLNFHVGPFANFQQEQTFITPAGTGFDVSYW
jgi:hypothetical protein